MRTGIVSLIADVFAGLAALFLFFLGDGYFHVAADLRTAVVVWPFRTSRQGSSAAGGAGPRTSGSKVLW